MKTNSNSYTVIYSAVMVIVVAFLLAFVFQALKPIQDVNVALDKQKQILYSLLMTYGKPLTQELTTYLLPKREFRC